MYLEIFRAPATCWLFSRTGGGPAICECQVTVMSGDDYRHHPPHGDMFVDVCYTSAVFSLKCFRKHFQ